MDTQRSVINSAWSSESRLIRFANNFDDRPESRSNVPHNAAEGQESTLESEFHLESDTPENLENAVQDEALHRMQTGTEQSEKQEASVKNLGNDINTLLESTKDMSREQQAEKIREFNTATLHPEGHNLSLIAEEMKVSNHTAEDPRIAIYRAKLAELNAEISGTLTAINHLRVHSIAPMAREYRGFKSTMYRRGNRAPEIAKYLMQFPAAGAAAQAPTLKGLYEQLAKKQGELAMLKAKTWRGMTVPVAATPEPAPVVPTVETPAPRFENAGRKPNRMQLGQTLENLDPATLDAIRSLAPELQDNVLQCIDQLNPEEKETLILLCNKLRGLGPKLLNVQFFDANGKLRSSADMRSEAALYKEKANALELSAVFVDSLSPAERALFEKIVGLVQARKQERVSGGADDPVRIARHLEYWKKAKESGDEASLQVAEGMLMMNGVNVMDSNLEKGELVMYESGFMGRGVGFFLGLFMVVEGILKKLGDKREERKSGKKKEKPMNELTKEEREKEIKDSEKRLAEGKKEKGEIEKQIKSGEKELEKETGEEPKSLLRQKLEDLRSKLQKVEEAMKKEVEKIAELKKPVGKKNTETTDVEKGNPLLEKFNKNKDVTKKKIREMLIEKIRVLNPDDPKSATQREKLLDLLNMSDANTDAMSLEKNAEGKYRFVFDLPSIVNSSANDPAKKTDAARKEQAEVMIQSMQQNLGNDAPLFGLYAENGQVITIWMTEEMVEKFGNLGLKTLDNRHESTPPENDD